MNMAEEWDWLEAARATGDRAAAEALAARFGAVVLGACRRILGDEAAAAEAFEATFLLLFRRGPRRRRRGDLAAWLHRMACRVAVHSRAGRGEAAPRGGRFDLGRLVDRAVDRLRVGRSAVIARDLMGMTREQAAARLGCPIRALDRRLELARRSIDARLRREARPAIRSGRAAVVGFISLEALADVEAPDWMRQVVVRTAARLAGDREWAAQVSAEVTRLARTAAAGLVFSRLRKAAGSAMVVGIVGAGACLAALHGADDPRQAPRASPPVNEAAPPRRAGAESPAARGRAEALRAGRADAARRSYSAAIDEFGRERVDLGAVHRTSRALLDAEMDGAATPSRIASALAGHRDRMASLVKLAAAGPHGGSAPAAIEAQALLAEADLWLARGGREPDDGDRRGRGADDGASASVLARLDQEIALDFPRPTPLGDVLEQVRRSAPGPDGRPLPVYVDPVGLKRAGVDLSAPVSIALGAVPLRRSLQLLLSQVGLTSYVEGGVVVVTSADDGATTSKASPLDRERERAGRGEMSVTEMKALAEKLRLLREIEDLPDGRIRR